jgi:hypothetical protein
MKYKGKTKLEKQCLSYIQDNLKAPPQSLVFKWGKKLNLDYQEIKQINDRIHLRANLGPDPGFLSNTKNWKRTTPRSFRSPYYAQGDIGNRNYIKQAFYLFIILIFYLGFFSYNNKKYGQFFCAVQTFTGKVFAVPIPNVKTDSLIEAIHKMTQVLFSTG